MIDFLAGFIVAAVLIAATLWWRGRRRPSRRRAREAERWNILEHLLSNIPVAIYWKDSDSLYRGANERFLANAGAERLADLIGKSDHDLPWSSDEAHAYRRNDRIVIATGHPLLDLEETQLNASGEHLILSSSRIPLRDGRGRVHGILGIYSDVTERQKNQQMLINYAFYDSLTGLPNRRLLRERLEQSLGRMRRRKRNVALLFLDLDDFKRINDTLGHDAGDRLLVQVAQRLRSGLRESDTVARMSGDEFNVLLEDVRGPADVQNVAHKLLEALRAPIRIDSHEILVTTSIGITIAPKDGDESKTLLRNADIALYDAKGGGGARLRFFSAEMNERAKKRLEIENELRRALRSGEFQLAYQPLVHLATRRVESVEALLRWHHPERGLIPPNDFIDIAEETGLIVPLGNWVLRRACEEVLANPRLGANGPRVAVNLSLRQFRDPELLLVMRQTLADCRVDPRRLELEVTESAVMDDLEATLAVLAELKGLGITISIDDFGTGYSSLAQLKRLPVDTVKVDRAFVRDIPDDKEDLAITSAIIAMAHKMNLRVVAEGIETRQQLHFLEENGCDVGQGFLFSKGVSIGELEATIDGCGSLD